MSEFEKYDNEVSDFDYSEFGTDQDFDTYAVEVMNGNGYYDDFGNFHWYRVDDFYDYF